jgi:ketosteroid isomerase-like protein
MATGNDQLVRSSFDAFLRGDWNALAEVMAPDVQWLWYEPGDWDCHDRRKVLATLFERQREGVVTELADVVAVDERVFVEVAGAGGHGCMVVTIRDGRIVRMQDYPNRAAALAGAGLPPEPAEAVEDEELVGDEPILNPDAPLARKVTEAIRTGAVAAVEQLLREHPALARARLGDPARGQSRTLLHVVTDWPGNASAPRSAGRRP